MTTQSNQKFMGLPRTYLGWGAVILLGVFVVMNIINQAVFMNLSSEVAWRTTVLPFYGIFMLLIGLFSGVTGLVAILSKHERSWLVWLTLLPAAFVLLLLVGEFLFPH